MNPRRPFVYFLPGLGEPATREGVLQSFPLLAYAFPPHLSFTAAAVERGPGDDHAPGLLAWACKTPPIYDPDKQDWQPFHLVDEERRPWLALPKDRAAWPGPAELQKRERSIEGHLVTLGDGQQWSIPVVRRHPSGTSLPVICVMGPDGPESRVSKQYEELYQRACAMRLQLFGDPPEAPSVNDALWLAEAALAVNYRLGAWELGMLELVDTECIRDVCEAVLDGPALKAYLDELTGKKKSASSPSRN